MPLNTTVSHISPLVSYIPRSAWYEGDSSDPDLDKYSNKSYHYSNSTASVTFSWWGTGIWVFGGRRNWSGEYRVVLDDQEPQIFPGYAGGADEFQQVLFGSSNLPYAPHQIRITNTGASPATQSKLDIDYFVYETTLAENGRIYHSDPGCTWHPANQNVWQVDETSHTTYDDLGAMELNFTVCSGITVYGYIGKTNAPLSVSVDGWAFAPLTPNTDITPLVPNVTHILYTNSNLQEGPHTLRVENNPLPMNGSGSRMSIAYSQILSSSDSSSSGGSSSDGETDSHRRTVVLAASFSALGAFFLSILVWRLVVFYRRRKQSHKELVAPRPFYARTNPSSPPQSPRPRPRLGRQKRWPQEDDDPEAQTAILPHTASRTPGARRTRRVGHRRPPSDIEFARSWTSSRIDSEAAADAPTYMHAHGHSRSYDELGYPRTSPYPYPDDAVWDSELTSLRHARNASAASSSASSHTFRDSFSMHATAPTSPATPMFSRERPPPTIPITHPLRANSKRQQRRPRSTEKPPLDVEQQLAMFASASNARRAGVGAGVGAETGMRLVGSPVVSLPSSRPSTATGTGSFNARPLPPPPVPLVPTHLRAAVRSPSQNAFNDPWDVGMGLPPPYRLLDMH